MQMKELFLEKWALKYSSRSLLRQANHSQDSPFLPFNLIFFFFLALRKFLAVHLYRVPFYLTFKTVVIHRWYRFCYPDRSVSDCWIRHIFPFDSWLAIFFSVYAELLSCSYKYIQHHSSATWQALADSNPRKKLCLFL